MIIARLALQVSREAQKDEEEKQMFHNSFRFNGEKSRV